MMPDTFEANGETKAPNITVMKIVTSYLEIKAYFSQRLALKVSER